MPEPAFPQPDTADIVVTDVLRALADPGRLKIVQVLSDGDPHGCNVESFGLDIQKSTLSHHLRTLREAGLTTVTASGRTHQVSLRKSDLDARFPGLIESVTSAAAAAAVAPSAG